MGSSALATSLSQPAGQGPGGQEGPARDWSRHMARDRGRDAGQTHKHAARVMLYVG